MTIEELVEEIKIDTLKILEEFLIDNPLLIAMTLLNGVRLICIEEHQGDLQRLPNGADRIGPDRSGIR